MTCKEVGIEEPIFDNETESQSSGPAAKSIHQIGDGSLWYFPSKGSAGYQVLAASPLKHPTWKLQCAYIGRVDLIPPSEHIILQLLQLPRFHSWTTHRKAKPRHV